jgi:hypothetical protein
MCWVNRPIARLLRPAVRLLCPYLVLACIAQPCRGEDEIRATQPQLRAWARDCLANKWVSFQQPEYWQDGKTLGNRPVP